MKKASVLELKKSSLKSLRKALRPSGPSVESIIPVIQNRIAVGYSRLEKDDYRLEIRVQRKDGPAYKQALQIKEEAHDEANIEVVRQIAIPTRLEIEDADPHPALIKRVRPLQIGLSIAHRDGAAGTLGAFVDTDDGHCILSNSHVLAQPSAAAENDPIFQPGRPDVARLNNKGQIGRLYSYDVLSRNVSNDCDSAIALLEKDESHIGNVIPAGCGSPFAGGKIVLREQIEDLLTKGREVYKIGRTTGWSVGTIDAVAVDDLIVSSGLGNLIYSDVIQIEWMDQKKPFSLPGDSGSLVFLQDGDEFVAFGLHFAGGKKEGGEGVSFTCNLALALDSHSATFL